MLFIFDWPHFSLKILLLVIDLTLSLAHLGLVIMDQVIISQYHG